ncbi:MAG: hypothetical protein WAV85_17265 [Rhodoferax sp.]
MQTRMPGGAAGRSLAVDPLPMSKKQQFIDLSKKIDNLTKAFTSRMYDSIAVLRIFTRNPELP